MHEQSEFPAKLFLARFEGPGALAAVAAALAADLFIITIQAIVQDVLAKSRNKY